MELLTVKKYVLGPLETNSYLVIGPKGNALLVDAPPGALTIALYLVDRNIVNLTHILITHAHFDHVADAEPIKEASGAKLVMGRDDMLILSESERWARAYGIRWFRPDPDILLVEDTVLDLGWIKVNAYHTPGHSPGSTCYYIDDLKILFSGDVIFKGSVGRTDLIGGSTKDMIRTLRKLILLLPRDTRIAPGHGPETTLNDELKFNPYLKVIVDKFKLTPK